MFTDARNFALTGDPLRDRRLHRAPRGAVAAEGSHAATIVGSIGVATYRRTVDDTLPAGLPTRVRSTAGDTLGGAVAAARGLPPDLATAVLEPARAAFSAGLNIGAGVAAGIVAIVAIFAATVPRHVPPTGSRES